MLCHEIREVISKLINGGRTIEDIPKRGRLFGYEQRITLALKIAITLRYP